MTEAELTRTLVEAAMLLGYRVHHSLPARSNKGWHTPVQGHRGLPDLVIAGYGVLILAELKVKGGRLRPDQMEWQAAIPPDQYRLWTDHNYREAIAELQWIRSHHPNGVAGHAARSQSA